MGLITFMVGRADADGLREVSCAGEKAKVRFSSDFKTGEIVGEVTDKARDIIGFALMHEGRERILAIIKHEQPVGA